MNEINKLFCDVCGNEAKGVASSSLGAISFAYCQECLSENAEPYDMLVYYIAEFTPDKFINELSNISYKDFSFDDDYAWIVNTLRGTLNRTGKTIFEFKNDILNEKQRIQEDEFMWYTAALDNEGIIEEDDFLLEEDDLFFEDNDDLWGEENEEN